MIHAIPYFLQIVVKNDVLAHRQRADLLQFRLPGKTGVW